MDEYDDLLARVRSGSTVPAAPAAPKVDEYDSLLKQVRSHDLVPAQTANYNGSFSNPAQAAERLNLARDIKKMLGEDIAPSIIDPVEDRRRIRQAEMDHGISQSASLRKWIEDDPGNAGLVGQKDIGSLLTVDGALHAARRAFGSAAAGLTADPAAAFYTTAAMPFKLGEQAAGLVLPDWMAQSEMGKALLWAARASKATGDVAAGARGDEGNIEAGVYSGFRSLGGNLGTMLTGGAIGLGAKGTTAMMSAIAGGGSALKAFDQGASATTALALGGADMAAEYATELTGMKALLATPGLKQGIASFARSAANFGVKEMLGEQVATVWQDFNEWALLNPEKTLDDFIAARPDAAIQTAVATLVGGGGQIAIQQAMARGRQAETRALFDALHEGAQNSDLLKAVPEKYREFVKKATADGGIDTVFIPAEQFTTYFQGRDMDPALIAKELGASNYVEAMAAGSDVMIPMDAFATLIAGTDHYAGLADDLRLSQGDLTARELALAEANKEESEKELEAELKRLATETEPGLNAQIKQITDDVALQLGARYDKQTSETMSQVMRGIAVVTARDVQSSAQEHGKTASEAEIQKAIAAQLAKYDIRINANPPLPEILAKRPNFKAEIDPYIDMIRAGQGPSEQDIFGTSLVDFIRSKGGLAPVGELKDVEQYKTPAFKSKLIQDLGKRLDEMAMAAVEAGYFPGTENGQLTETQLVEAILNELGGDQKSFAGFNESKLNTRETLEGLAKAMEQYGLDPATMDNEAIKAALFPEATFEQAQPDGLRVVDVFGSGSRIDHYDDKRGLMYSMQKTATGEKWTVFEVFPASEGGDQVLGEMFKYRSMDEAKAAVRGLRISAAQRAKQSSKYGAIPNLWSGEAKKIAKALIDAGVVIDRFASSTQSKSKYIYTDKGLKLRLADHSLPNAYDSPDLDFRYGGDVNAFVYEVVDAEQKVGAGGTAFKAVGSKRVTQDALDNFEIKLKEKYGLDKISLIDIGDNEMEVSAIIVPKGMRSQGVGSKAMEEIVAFADKNGLRIVLDPASRGDPFMPGTTSRARLVEFYKRFGFTDNKGRKRDFSISYGMYRDPISLSSESRTPAFKAVDTESPEFKAWSGGAPIKAEGFKTGEAVVIRGQHASTYGDITEFKTEEQRFGKAGYGFYFSDAAGANLFAEYGDRFQMPRSAQGEEKAVKTYPVFIAMRNPLVVDHVDDLKPYLDAGQKFGVARGIFGNLVPDAITKLQKQGYDGIISRETTAPKVHKTQGLKILDRNDPKATSFPVFVAFRPEQIKSAISNTGAFSATNPNILYQPENRAQIRIGADRKINIDLLKDANLSSFLHETGHFYLEFLGDLAENGSQQTKDDYAAILKWMGVTSRDQIKVEHHEMFARANERYLMEGKAPSKELRSAFARFKAWLKMIYRDLKNLNVPMNDEVREVFDRIYATDAEIAAARAENDFIDTFATAEQMGVSQAEFDAYKKQAAGEIQEGTDELRNKIMRVQRLKREQWWRDELAKTKEEVGTELDAMKEYQTFDALSEKDSELKIDRQDLIERYGAPILKRLPRGYGEGRGAIYTAADERGSSVETVAQLMGYASGDTLIEDMANLKSRRKLIAAEADARMNERYGDILNSIEVADEAQESLHNEARGKKLAMEVRALNKAIGRALIDPESVMREAARRVMAAKLIRDVRPNDYLISERKANREAFKLMAENNRIEAFEAKQRELLNFAMYREAVRVKDEMKKLRDFAIRFEKGPMREKLGKAGEQYLEAAQAILEDVELTNKSLKAIDRAKIRQWLQLQENADLYVTDDMVSGTFAKNWKDLTVDEMRAISDALKNIDHVAGRQLKIMSGQRAIDLAEWAARASESIRKNGGEPKFSMEEEGTFARRFHSFNAQNRKLSSLARQMDGDVEFGPMFQGLILGMNERGAWEADENAKATKALIELYRPILAMKGGTGDMKYIPELGVSLSRGARLSMLLNWGNEGNRQRLQASNYGRGVLTQDQINAVWKTITRSEAEFVNGVWKFIDSYWPQIAAKEKRVYGVAPEKVEALPFSMTLADGTNIQMTGGYYPIKYDATKDDKAAAHDQSQLADEVMRGAFTAQTTRKGHTEARMAEVKRPVRLSLNVITEHVAQVTHDLAYHEWLIDATKIMRNKAVASAIREHYGDPVLKTMRDALTGIAVGDLANQTAVDAALLHLRANVQRSTMGFSLTTAFLQPFGLTQSMARIGVKPVLNGIAHWAGDVAHLENSLTKIREKSVFMQGRGETFNRELHEIKGRVTGQQSKARQIYDASLFMMMQKMQMIADVPTWIGAYNKATESGIIESEAIAIADRAVIESQGGGQTKDLSEFQRKHPMLNVFFSYFSVTYNLMAESTAKAKFSNPASLAGWAADMMLLAVIPALGPAVLLSLLRGEGDDDEEEWMKKLVKWQTAYLLGTVPLLREFSGTVEGYGYAGPPAARIVSDTQKFGAQLVRAWQNEGEVDEAGVLSFVRLMGTVLGVPTTQAVRSYKGWKAWEEGTAPATSILVGPPRND